MTSIWKQKPTLEEINTRGQNTLVSYLGIEFIDIGPNFLKAQMEVTEKLLQPYGILHGGASCALAESVGSTAANYTVDNSEMYCVGIDINANHIRPVTSGIVVAIAKPFHLGKKTQVWSIEIFNSEDKLICISRLTLGVLSR